MASGKEKPGMVKRLGDAMKNAEKGKYGYNRPKPPPPKQGGVKRKK